MNEYMYRVIKTIAKAEIVLNEIVEMDVFKRTSKHESLWNSTDEKQDDFLDEVRCSLRGIQEKIEGLIGDIYGLKRKDDK